MLHNITNKTVTQRDWGGKLNTRPKTILNTAYTGMASKTSKTAVNIHG